ncbi:hypothetical protein [Pedobacter mucosus]|uniref:hypothetical protein n=1 Tax=Pedobacter mucosus TaxID=2895286 RepID=UPI001EE3C55C|nr:hypothetical protein [Pedobacter mucosus]UKT62387.1 hypothetical protein LOK61_11515 [Pedobacter mucosus]
MKKSKAKSRNHSKIKKLKKDLEVKLTYSFNEVIDLLGTAKKTDKIIEKFAKQLAKKVTFKAEDKSIAHFVKEDQLTDKITVDVEAVKADLKKAKAAKSIKATTDK